MAYVAVVAGLALLALAVLVTVVQFNRMVSLRNRVRESWANVDTELLRRHDLVPNLVQAVQGYAAHERAVLEQVTRARAEAMRTRGFSPGHVDAEARLERSLTRLLAVAESYPALKASRNFLQLQEELAITEDRIQAARRFYNGNVRDYRNATRQFPGLLFASLFGFRSLPFFEAEPGARQAPSASFQRTTG